tara:strand:+ start:70 stop:474 length:405 start_codon:yes stop_codon:yes gene_type:complete
MKEDLEFLESYLMTEYDIEVVWGKDEIDAFYYNDACIGICTRHTKEIQLFCLLHEAGHAILRARESFFDEYPHVHKNGKTQLSRMDVIREEMDAWTEGEKLARHLGIKIDKPKWNRYWKHQVYKYVEWAVEKDK